MKGFIQKTTILLSVAFTLMGLNSNTAILALNAGDTYTINLHEVNSDGSVSDTVSHTTTANADDNGKVTYTFSGLKSCDTNNTNFYVLKTKDSSGTVVRTTLAPASRKGISNSLGSNELANKQSLMVLKGFEVAQSDDTLFAAFGYVLTRSDDISDEDMTLLSRGGNAVLFGEAGFIPELKELGATEEQVTAFKKALVCNSDEKAQTLATYAKKFKDAVDATDASSKSNKESEAGGLMATIFIDAAKAAEIDLRIITSAFNNAGDAADNNQDFQNVSTKGRNSMNASFAQLGMKMESAQQQRRYEKALTDLNATETQKTRFNTAVNTLNTAHQSIEATFSDYFGDPAAFVAANSGTYADINAVERALSVAFQTAYETFQVNIAATDDEITALKSTVNAIFPSGQEVDNNFGTRVIYKRDQSTENVNVSICEVVLWTFYTTIKSNNGDVTYTRGTETIPNTFWESSRISFDDDPLKVLNEIRQDFEIIQHIFYTANDAANNKSERKAAVSAYDKSVKALMNRIVGTTNGSTAISNAQKRAALELLAQVH